jgi:hypothetical protein
MTTATTTTPQFTTQGGAGSLRETSATSKLLRWAGLSAVLAGTCYVLVGLFHPANVASSVTTTPWQVVHILACAVCFFGLLGIAGLHARQARKTGWLGLAGYLLLSLWFTLIMGFSFVEAFILPHLAIPEPVVRPGLDGNVQRPWRAVRPRRPANDMDTDSAGVHSRWLAVRRRDVPRTHPASLGRCTACHLHGGCAVGCLASQRGPTENGGAVRSSPGLARLCALVRASSPRCLTTSPCPRR